MDLEDGVGDRGGFQSEFDGESMFTRRFVSLVCGFVIEVAETHW